MNKVIVLESIATPEDQAEVIRLLSTLELGPFQDNDMVQVAPPTPEVLALVKKYGDALIGATRQLYDIDKPLYTHMGFLSYWQPGTFAGPHVDSHGYEFLTQTGLVYINDDYEGGEIYFPNLDGMEIKPKAASAILFPARGDENFHGVREVKGPRYTIAFWFTSDLSKANPDLL